MWPAVPLPKTPFAICEMTVFLSLGTTCIFIASHEIPMNMMPRHAPMTISVERAFFHSGFLNAGTPLEIASTPVMAAPPDAKAWSSRKMPDRARHADRHVVGGDRRVGEAAGRRLVHADADHHEDADEERVGRHREHPARLPHAAQVAPGDDDDEAERDRDAVRAQVAERRVERGDAGRHRHRDGEDVVGEQRDPGHLGRAAGRGCPW